ncbi:MAG: ATP synthase F1 subunit gamma [Candidatus Marinimicrobia bacterium]|jgi:F-type H+-transporting ATPase subunit gamma|nr:ATP synthase F1 subunit gamma [Candidatus Neomarinimicrobiota bacterium]MDP6457371.1 ATP synthase F1 subunit gamma [Candidatus Neomarinimicrobiota bacterium]MDP6593507.1 ATP synthase F1 subunit gamma [Candidatus Neomarinimicrobiota bacterium]|tara:strand:+ start:10322 stop:11182 length:861 start_codon:yes stop_codon:yes gene_type:complete
MANLKDIRERIRSVKSIQQVTKAMKMVAAAKMRRAQERMEQARPYADRLSGVIESLLPEVDRQLLPLLEVREVKRMAVVVVTSDRGLAGSFNSNIIRRAEEVISAFGKQNVDLFCIGRKGHDYFRKRDYDITEEHTDFWNDLSFGHAIRFGEGIVNHFTGGSVDKVTVVFNWFKNIATQELRAEDLLPLVYDEGETKPVDRLYEPSKSEIVQSLVPRHVTIQVWRYLLESFASEQAARMVAMENATENAGELIKDLTLEFNKARQASITKEMLEIVSGAEALSMQG